MKAEEIRDRESLEKWLETVPVDERCEVAVTIANRAAMRLVPWIFGYENLGKRTHLQLFKNLRMLIATRFWPALPINGLLTVGTESVARPAYEAVYAAKSDSPFIAAESASYAVHYASKISREQFWSDEVWLETRIDASNFDRRLSEWNVNVIRSTFPLWLNYRPEFFDNEYSRFVAKLRLLDWELAGWPIWLEWYEPIIEGKPAFNLKDRAAAEALERNIALGSKDGKFNEDFWKREPREINAEIAEWVAQERAKEGRVQTHPPLEVDDALPKQDVTAVTFGLTDDGRIDRLPVPPEHRLLITPPQQREYAATRAYAEALAGLGQQLGKLAAEVAALRAAMPEDMATANVFDLWRALNRLRRTFNAHERVRDLADPHEARLEPAVAEELGHLLDSANNFAFGDPGLRRRDENAIPPQDRPSIEEEAKLGAPLVSVIINAQGVLTADAEAAVNAEEQNGATAGDDPHGLQAQDQRNKTRRNLIAATLDVLKRVSPIEWAEFKKEFSKKMAGWTYKLIMTYIIANIPAVQAFARLVWNSPALNKLLDALAKMVAGV